MAITYSSAMETGSSARISSTIVEMRPWGPFGATSTSRRWGARRFGKPRRRVILSPRRTSGGTGTITMRPRRRRIPNGSKFLTPEKLPLERATQRREEGAPRKNLTGRGTLLNILCAAEFAADGWEEIPWRPSKKVTITAPLWGEAKD